MHLPTKVAGLTAALSLLAVPAFAAPPEGAGKPATAGKSATAPAQICKAQNLSRKKVGKQTKSAFAACVIGVKAAQREAAAEADDPQATPTAPGQLCRGLSRKKVKGQPKSLFASCVVGAAKAQTLEEEQEQTSPTAS